MLDTWTEKLFAEFGGYTWEPQIDFRVWRAGFFKDAIEFSISLTLSCKHNYLKVTVSQTSHIYSAYLQIYYFQTMDKQ